MILINLLPPEMRKKQGDINPLVYAVAACYLAAFIPVGTWGWLKYSRLPAAELELVRVNEVLVAKTDEASAVEKLEAQIAEYESHRNEIVGLLARKVYWARTINEFANHLDGPDGIPWKGFDVCCTELTIQPITLSRTDPANATKREESVTLGFRGRYKLLGMERDKAGDYVRDFFLTTEMSKFWAQTGFQGKPEASYKGDTPEWKPAISRVAVEFTLDWIRMKKIATAPVKVAAPAPAPQGGG